jgi:hypothetical protein
MTEAVQFYTSKQVRVCDLRTLYQAIKNEWLVIRIDGRWREVLNVWDRPEQYEIELFPDELAQVERHLDTVTEIYVAVRYLLEEESADDHLENRLVFLRWRDLVEVQVPEEGFEWKAG